jgi:hypothetical protein
MMDMRFDVYMTMNMYITVFWEFMPCSLVEHNASIFRVA